MVQMYAQFTKSLDINSSPHFVSGFSCYILLTHQVLLPYCLYFLIYSSKCVLQLFVDQVVMSKVFKLTLSFSSGYFSTWSKIQDKNLNILRLKRAFKVKQKVFFITFKGLLVVKNPLRPKSVPLLV